MISFGFLALLSILLFQRIKSSEYIFLLVSFLFIFIGFLVDSLCFFIWLYESILGKMRPLSPFILEHQACFLISLVLLLLGYTMLLLTIKRLSYTVLIPISYILVNTLFTLLLLTISAVIIYFERNSILRQPSKLSFLFLALSYLSINISIIFVYEILYLSLVFRVIGAFLVLYSILTGALSHD